MSQQKKIVFLGPPGVGKTSMRKFVFEAQPAPSILSKEEPPSIGVKFNKYDYAFSYPIEFEGGSSEKVPMQLAVVDTSGQELERWLTVSKDRVFTGADTVFFMFDISEWDNEQRQEYLKDLIAFTNDARMELCPEAQFHVVANKFDKIQDSKDKKEAKMSIKMALQDYIFIKKRLMFDFSVLVTSLEKEYMRDTFFTILNYCTELVSEA